MNGVTPPFEVDADTAYEFSESTTALILSACCMMRLLLGPMMLPGAKKADVSGRHAEERERYEVSKWCVMCFLIQVRGALLCVWIFSNVCLPFVSSAGKLVDLE